MLNPVYWNQYEENANLQPDITLIVGNSMKFFAHKFVLSNHSGYFKTLLSSYKGYEVHVSNINSHTFASLLTFMYTGQLELNALNVYEIFLASNLLHITEALTLCRRYLSETQLAKSIVKPIPCKKAAVPDAVRTIQTLKYQPLRIDEQASSIFKPVRNTKIDNTDETKQPQRDDTKSANVILDIACCDGPIKFRKVINKYYDPKKAAVTDKSQLSAACHGCKHVFKNYRRLGKYVTSVGILQNKSNAVDTKSKKKSETNMQCYTCKTCGSKFPSYYFVHKHRKLHHAEGHESADQ